MAVFSRNLLRLAGGTLGLLLTLALAAPAGIAVAQEAQTAEAAAPDAEAVARGFKAWRGSDCAGCHGWGGNGEKIGENPKGPSLRRLQMEAEFIYEVIQCGRPGTQMPSHDRLAYTDDRCYGMDAKAVGDQRPPKGKTLTEEQARDIVAYIQANLIGKSDTLTKAECQAYYGKKPFCDSYPETAPAPTE